MELSKDLMVFMPSFRTLLQLRLLGIAFSTCSFFGLMGDGVPALSSSTLLPVGLEQGALRGTLAKCLAERRQSSSSKAKLE